MSLTGDIMAIMAQVWLRKYKCVALLETGPFV